MLNQESNIKCYLLTLIHTLKGERLKIERILEDVNGKKENSEGKSTIFSLIQQFEIYKRKLSLI